MNNQQKRRKEDTGMSMGVTERHIQTGAVAIIIGLIIWVGTSVSGNSTTLATLAERSSHQSEQIKEIKADLAVSSDNTYSISDAARDGRYVIGRLDSLESRVSTIEEYHRNEPK